LSYVPFCPQWASTLLWGWRRANGYVRPNRYRIGLVLIAAGCICIWLFPFTVLVLVGTELQGLLALIALAFGAGLLGGGIELIRRANTRPEQDFWDG
jgi:hypothetical protein